MAERSRFWDGSTVGDAVSITDNEFMDRFFRALFNGTGNQGVLQGWLNELEVTDGGGLNATVDTGGALCYGGWYENDAAATVVVPNNSTVYVIVSRVWGATQTARLTHDGGAGLTQNPGTQYDIPLAQVTTVGGAITLITDARDYCTASTLFQDGAITDDSIQADAVTPIKMENQTRWVTRGLNQLKADATNPATLANAGDSSTGGGWVPWRAYWSFSDAVSDTVWCTFRAPVDMVGASFSVYVWGSVPTTPHEATIRWAFSAQVAAASAALGPQVGAATVVYTKQTSVVALTYPVPAWWTALTGYPTSVEFPTTWRYAQRDLVGTIPAAAGDIVHVEFWRDGGHGGDTHTGEMGMFMLEFAYEADS